VTLVKVRCRARGCGKLLTEVVSAHADGDELRWNSWVVIPVCPRHGGDHDYGSVAKWVEDRRRKNLPTDRRRTGRWICWAELRPAVRRARATGRTQTHRL
jgi:hypothetical protein